MGEKRFFESQAGTQSASHITSIVKNEEIVVHASLLLALFLGSPFLGDVATRSGLGFPLLINNLHRQAYRPT